MGHRRRALNGLVAVVAALVPACAPALPPPVIRDAANERVEDVADCVVDAIRKLRFRPSAPRAAKVSFEIR